MTQKILSGVYNIKSKSWTIGTIYHLKHYLASYKHLGLYLKYLVFQHDPSNAVVFVHKHSSALCINKSSYQTVL